jgi:hypothetical protein
MQRNLDFLRTILLRCERVTPGTNLLEFDLSDIPFAEQAHHIELLVDAGLLRAQITYMESSSVPVYVVIERLTWSGHEFLDLARDDVQWQKVLAHVAMGTGATSFEIVSQLLYDAHLATLTRH